MVTILGSVAWLGAATALVIAGLGLAANWDGWADRMTDWHNSYPFRVRDVGENYYPMIGVIAITFGCVLYWGWFASVMR